MKFFRFVQMLFIQIYPYVCSVQWKMLCSCIFKISVHHLPCVWKKNYCFGKKSGKRLEFCLQKSVWTLYWLPSHWHSSHWRIHKSDILLPVTQWLMSIPQGMGRGKGGVFKLLSTSNQTYRVTIRPFVPPLVRLNFIAGLLSALTFVFLLTFEFGCSKGELR